MFYYVPKMFYYAPKMFYYAPKMLYYASICYYAFNVYYAQNYASRIRQGLNPGLLPCLVSQLTLLAEIVYC